MTNRRATTTKKNRPTLPFLSPLHHHTHHQTIDPSLHVISCRLLGGCVVDVEVTFLTRVVGNKPQLQDIAHMRFSVPAVEGVLLRRGKACCKKRSQGLFLILTPTHDSAARRKPSKSHQQSLSNLDLTRIQKRENRRCVYEVYSKV